MNLCNICQNFDIRALLLASEAQKPEATGALSRTQIDAQDFRAPLPKFFKYHNDIIALKHSAARCSLCEFFWITWVKTVTKPDITEEWLKTTFQGELYVGCSSWTTSGQGFPYVTLTQHTASGASRTLCSFEAFADRDDLPEDGQTLVGRAVSPDSSSVGCVALASEWLHACLKDHPECGTSHDVKPLPTRVIDVGDENQHPKLVTTNSKNGVYIALSYCWGGDSNFIFNDSRKHALESGIPVDEFPATLRDAVLITRRLGIQYVWIDALCIKQDSAEDWANEAAKMKDVYSNSIITVIASNSPSTRSGIFSLRQANLRGALEYKGPTRTSQMYLRSGNELWDHSLQSSPLMGRGWTLQEGLLAPRTLSYGSQQMIWECSQFQADEGGRTTKATEDYRSKGFIQRLIRNGEADTANTQQSLFSKLTSRYIKREEWWRSFSVANPYDKWYDICEQFMGRSLTKDFDVLPALSGLAGVFQHLLDDKYYAGLWKKDLMCSLIWSRSPRYVTDGSSRFDPTRKSGYLSPSWSWASVPGKISSVSTNWITRNALQHPGTTTAKIISVNTTPAGPDPFGKVSSGELVLRARYRQLEHLPPIYSKQSEWPDEKPEWINDSAVQKFLYKVMHKVETIMYERYQQHESCPSQEYGVIELVRWEKAPASNVPGMDLLFVESTGRKEGEFRRIGHTGLMKSPVPIKEEVTESMYDGIVEENNAFDAAVKENWGKRIITLV